MNTMVDYTNKPLGRIHDLNYDEVAVCPKCKRKGLTTAPREMLSRRQYIHRANITDLTYFPIDYCVIEGNEAIHAPQ